MQLFMTMDTSSVVGQLVIKSVVFQIHKKLEREGSLKQLHF